LSGFRHEPPAAFRAEFLEHVAQRRLTGNAEPLQMSNASCENRLPPVTLALVRPNLDTLARCVLKLS
jgi:hypothetical protein